MVRTQIRLTEMQAQSLKKLAASRHLSVAELIRQGVDRILQSGAVVDAEEKTRRALAVAGRYRSGRHDVSREHDRHLTEALGR